MNRNNEMNDSLLSEAEIDQIVEQQANDESAWESSIFVHRNATSVFLPSEVAAKAVFFANLHRETNVETWLIRVIQERIQLEEAAFLQIKGDLVKDSSK